MKDSDIFTTNGIASADFNFWVGLYMDKFYDGFMEKKFTGTKCSKCGRVMVPPRNRCGICFAKAEEYVDLPDTGILKNFTIPSYKITDKRMLVMKRKVIIGLVKLDGADTAIAIPILNTEADSLKDDMKVKAVWADKPKGVPKDIKGFEPIGGG